MQNRQIEVFNKFAFTMLTFVMTSTVAADEVIIQQEKISFEKCLNVITTSENKLSIAPEIKDISEQKRIAIFTLVDGKLTIKCDGEKGNVTVSTEID